MTRIPAAAITRKALNVVFAVTTAVATAIVLVAAARTCPTSFGGMQ